MRTRSVSLLTVAVAVACSAGSAWAFLAAQNPPWGSANYNMSLSSITMACNSSGWFDVGIGAAFGITSFDWSNDKKDWALARPMDCEERLVTQANATKAANPATKVFTYRNLVKALPWFSTVRAKLEDPAYAGWFLRFRTDNTTYHVPQCDDNYDPPLCTPFYHDQEQTPEVPTPSNPNPDGSCSGTCDCGSIPCGEYLFDHRNASLRSWLVQEYILGPNGLGSGVTDGFFIDDFWCSNLINGTGACNDPVQGPTEIDPHAQEDMGLSDSDIADITKGWLETMTATQQAILSAGAYTWSLIPGQANANAEPWMTGPGSCTDTVRAACSPSSLWLTQPLMFGLNMGNSSNPLPYLEADIAAFLLMRGPWAWVGAGVWGMSWPVGITFNSSGNAVPRPPAMDLDYGVPVDATCSETAPGSGVFVRRWSKASVALDCNTYEGNITMAA